MPLDKNPLDENMQPEYSTNRSQPKSWAFSVAGWSITAAAHHRHDLRWRRLRRARAVIK
ncbi:hypothetical protein [Candidatus Spongiihabitans sp.]|uniref:hypothetical protein n=1 Tax=Candidatus Spongiihabitans sp. TaxID=3101308 RepID=UPI003C7C5F92